MRTTGNYFRFDKTIVRIGHWAAMDKAAKAIYPVIASFCNENGYAYLKIETISKYSGRGKKTVIRGISNLKLYRLVKVRKRLIKRGFRQNYYHVPSIAGQNDRYFPLHKELIVLKGDEKGIWFKLSSSEQALYIAMRTFSRFDFGRYSEISESLTGKRLSGADFDYWFITREWEWCQKSNNQLADWAGICRQRIPSTLRGLQRNGLIEPDHFGWMVSTRGNLPSSSANIFAP